MWSADSMEKNLLLGKIEGRRRRGWQRMKWLDGITDMSLSKLWRQWRTGKPSVLQSMGSKRVGHSWTTEQQFKNYFGLPPKMKIYWPDMNIPPQNGYHLIQRMDSLEKILMIAKTEGKRRRGWQRMRWLNSITNSRTYFWANSGRLWRTGKPGMLQFMGSQRVRHDLATEQQLQQIISL